MFPLRHITVPSLAALALLPASAAAQVGAPEPPSTPAPPPPALEVQKPSKKVLIREGQDARLLLGGRWYFRLDDLLAGEASRWYAQRDLSGWSATRVPNSWNATDLTQNRPTWGWYRKEFVLPKDPKGLKRAWKVRFEGSNYRTTVWLNGRKIGGFTGYFPFELDLKGLRKGRNSLVVRVSTLRSRTDLTHWRPAAFNGYGSGGWWNSGGLLREVYVRPVDTVDVERVQALPRVRRLGGPARVEVRTTLRNMTDPGPRRGAGPAPHRPGRGPAHQHEARDRARRWPPPARHARDHPEAEAVAARASRPVRAQRVRGPGAEAEAPLGPRSAAAPGGHLPPQLRGQEARVAAAACST